jgi:hypothetical protein
LTSYQLPKWQGRIKRGNLYVTVDIADKVFSDVCVLLSIWLQATHLPSLNSPAWV